MLYMRIAIAQLDVTKYTILLDYTWVERNTNINRNMFYTKPKHLIYLDVSLISYCYTYHGHVHCLLLSSFTHKKKMGLKCLGYICSKYLLRISRRNFVAFLLRARSHFKGVLRNHTNEKFFMI